MGPIRKSIERPTTVDCLRELGRVIQRDHDPTCIAAAQELQAAEKDAADASTKRADDADEGAASLNATEVLMLHRRLKMIQQRAVEVNKAALDHQISRPPAPPIVSPCKGIMACFSFMFLGVPSHYARRSFSCWCTACSRVRGRGHGSNSCGPNLRCKVVREPAKPDKWGCVQDPEFWSPQEDRQVSPGHF